MYGRQEKAERDNKRREGKMEYECGIWNMSVRKRVDRRKVEREVGGRSWGRREIEKETRERWKNIS